MIAALAGRQRDESLRTLSCYFISEFNEKSGSFPGPASHKRVGIAQVAARVLTKNGFVAIYGPFRISGTYTTRSNEAFDKEILAAHVPEWGLKDVRDLESAAKKHGVALKETIDMPANNFILIFGRA